MDLLTRRLALLIEIKGSISKIYSEIASWAGILVIAFVWIEECCSWTNIISENNFFAVIE